MLTDQDLVIGGVGIDVSVLAIGQDGLATFGNQSEGVGKAGSADGAGKGGDGGERELHFDCELDLQSRFGDRLNERNSGFFYTQEPQTYFMRTILN